MRTLARRSTSALVGIAAIVAIGTGTASATPATAAASSATVAPAAATVWYPYSHHPTRAACLAEAGRLHDSGQFGSNFKTLCSKETYGKFAGTWTLSTNK